MNRRRLLLLAVAATLITTSTPASTAPVDGNPCGPKDPRQVASQAVYCGDDAVCIARETATLPEAQRAFNCEMQRLSPVNVLNIPSAALPAPAQ
ncbi:hypothetical protein [Burkholderia vietnamiensis]|uniref:hypothetical protein n=1 Tax=Burkholderia vietnamiensis TaxID=60552 RepID=UPI001CF5EE57|nr:hypothetical protein [Burkholderia vietnamiensis]MCA8290025.1 hypothetical protein [Burkholderia vietnamiensis]